MAYATITTFSSAARDAGEFILRQIWRTRAAGQTNNKAQHLRLLLPGT